MAAHRRRQVRLVSGILALLLFTPLGLGAAERKITAAEARQHIGEEATVCGKVASSRYASGSTGHPTFLNLDKAYPDHIFTVVIWGEHRAKFAEPPEQTYRDKRLCVTGEISSYRKRPQIVVDDPRQIEVVREETATVRPRTQAPKARDCIPRSQCCKVCSTGKACGNSCISRSYNCHKGRGCACDSWEVCS